MYKEKVYEKVNNIIIKYFNFDFMKNKEFQDTSLTEMGLKGRDLLVLLMAVEAVLSIEIPESAIEKGRFNTYNDIVDLSFDQLYELKTK